LKRARLVAIFVGRDQNAIGYVPASLASNNSKVRVLFTLQ